jgi:hypothetical protein
MKDSGRDKPKAEARQLKTSVKNRSTKLCTQRLQIDSTTIEEADAATGGSLEAHGKRAEGPGQVPEHLV